jgi:hypothetical protein
MVDENLTMPDRSPFRRLAASLLISAVLPALAASPGCSTSEGTPAVGDAPVAKGDDLAKQRFERSQKGR